MAKRTNTREQVTMACHPGIHLVLHRPHTGEVIQQPEQGKANHGVKNCADGLSPMKAIAIRKDGPDRLLTLCHGQSMCLRNTGCLKRKTVQTVSPIQYP